MNKCYNLLYFIFLSTILLGQEASEVLPDSIDYSVELDEFVVTANYKPTHKNNALHIVDVITAQKIEERGATQLHEILTISPSIRVSHDMILGTQIKLRGINASNVKILIDGIPVIGQLDGGIDLAQIPLQNIKQIEIIEGPLSSIYGNNASGGIINIITKKSQKKKFEFATNNQIESIGRIQNQARIGFQNKKLLTAFHARRFEYNQYPTDSLRLINTFTTADNQVITETKYPWNPKIQYGIGALSSIFFNPNHKVTLKYDYNSENVSDYGNIRSSQFNPYANDVFMRTNRNDATVIYDGIINDKYYIELNAAYNLYERVLDRKRYYLETMEFDPLLQSADTTSFSAIFSRLNIAREFNDKITVIAGLNFNYETGSGERIAESSTHIQETAVYSEIKYIPKSNLRFAVNSRWLKHNIYQNNFIFGTQMKWDINKSWDLRASYAQGYRGPSLKELYLEFIDASHNIIGNTQLLPEKSHDIQATLTYSLDQNFTAKVNLYKVHIKNRITLFEYETLKYRYDNIGKYDVYGIKPDIQFQIKNIELNGSANIGFLSTELQANAPQYQTVFDMNYNIRYPIRWINTYINTNYRYLGKQPIYRLNDEVLEVITVNPATLLDISLSKRFFRDRINTVLGVKNLLNTQSANISGETNSTHSTFGKRIIDQGRSYFLKIDFTL